MDKMAKASKEQVKAALNALDVEGTELLPGEKAPEADPDPNPNQPAPAPVAGDEDGFEAIAEDEYGTEKRFPSFFNFEADGEAFTGTVLRLWDKGEHEHLEHACIEMRKHPNGARYYIPAYFQLWKLLREEQGRGVDFTKRIYRFTRECVVPSKKGTFMQFDTRAKDI